MYVLHKNEPKLEHGEVIFVGAPVPQYGQTFNAGNLMQQSMVVDVKIKCGEQTIELQRLPATQTITDYGNGMVVSESREAICNEIAVLRQNSLRVIESREQHEAIVHKCDDLLQELNPQIKQEATRTKEMESLGRRVGGLEESVERIEGLLIQALKSKNKKEE